MHTSPCVQPVFATASCMPDARESAAAVCVCVCMQNTNCWKDYRAVREINLGLYGPIYEGQNKETEQRVTIKVRLPAGTHMHLRPCCLCFDVSKSDRE